MTENKITVNSNSKEIINETVFSENCEFGLNDDCVLLCVTCESRVVETEPFDNEIKAAIVTSFNAVFKNAENEYESKIITKESFKTVAAEGATPESKVLLAAAASDCKFSPANGGSAHAAVTLYGWFLKKHTLEFLDSELENVHCKTCSVKVENISDLGKSSLILTHSDEARMPLKRILNHTASVLINNVYPTVGMIQVEGELTLRITAITDTGLYLSQSFSHPFGTEIIAEECKADSAVDIEPHVSKADITMTEDDARVFITDTEIELNYAIAEQTEINGVTDCYSEQNELNVKKNTTSLDFVFCYRTVIDKCSASIRLEEAANEVYCAFPPTVTKCGVYDKDGLTVEGKMVVPVLYDRGGCQTVSCEIPFKTEIAKEYECDAHLRPVLTVLDVTARLRTGTDVEVAVDYAVTVRGINKKELVLLSSVETGPEKEPDDYAISLYIVKPAETLWDVAKALNTSEDTILKLNEDLKLPLKGGEKILVYKELLFSV